VGFKVKEEMVIDIDRIREWVMGWNEEALLADGFEEAVVGMCERFGVVPVVAYDRDKCVGVLMERDGMGYEEAVEYFDFNVAGSYVGEGTPVFLTLWDKDGS
jgi:hypothetical protein